MHMFSEFLKRIQDLEVLIRAALFVIEKMESPSPFSKEQHSTRCFTYFHLACYFIWLGALDQPLD